MAVEPDSAQLAEIAVRARSAGDGPVVMLNLNCYRDRDEYMRYAEVALQVLERVGGRLQWHSDAQLTVIGDRRDRYDEVIAVWYPNLAAFTTFITHPDIVAARDHRLAGLDHAALICCSAGETDPAQPGVLSSELHR